MKPFTLVYSSSFSFFLFALFLPFFLPFLIYDNTVKSLFQKKIWKISSNVKKNPTSALLKQGLWLSFLKNVLVFFF